MKKKYYKHQYKDAVNKICKIIFDAPFVESETNLDTVTKFVEKLVEDNMKLQEINRKSMLLLKSSKIAVQDKANFFEKYKDDRSAVWHSLDYEIEEHLILNE